MTLFQELILISLGKQASFSHTPTDEEWMQMYEEADKQSLIGVCFVGVEKVPETQRPDMDLLMEWFGQTEYIKQGNRLVTERAAELTELFAEGGYRSVVLKGQGVALFYPQPELRESGDVDLWVDGRRKDVMQFMRQKGWDLGTTVVHHSDVEVFSDVSVEVHYYPSYTFSPFRWLKYKKWFAEKAEIQMQLMDRSVGFAHPAVEFNLVYSLLHIFRHVFGEGVGLRQLLDYYYILLHMDESARKEAVRTLKWLGLERFAGAVMYVEKEFFHLDDSHLLCETEEKAGMFMLDEIMIAGNFGKYDERVREAHNGSDLKLYFHTIRRLFRMVKFYPSEVLWAPVWKPVHLVWRMVNGYL